jgi:hypothetical protein
VRRKEDKEMNIKTFLAEYQFREVRITTHCSGVRLTLMQDHESVTSVTGADVDEAFKEALKYFPANLATLRERKKMELEMRKAELESQLRDVQSRIKKCEGKK